MVTNSTEGLAGNRLGRIEQRGIEPVPRSERNGNPIQWALTLGCGHVESSMGWRKRDDHHHGQEELLDGVSSAGR